MGGWLTTEQIHEAVRVLHSMGYTVSKDGTEYSLPETQRVLGEEGQNKTTTHSRRIGINPSAKGVVVRKINHFTECLVALYPERPDEACTCWDDSPEWTRD